MLRHAVAAITIITTTKTKTKKRPYIVAQLDSSTAKIDKQLTSIQQQLAEFTLITTTTRSSKRTASCYIIWCTQQRQIILMATFFPFNFLLLLLLLRSFCFCLYLCLHTNFHFPHLNFQFKYTNWTQIYMRADSWLLLALHFFDVFVFVVVSFSIFSIFICVNLYLISFSFCLSLSTTPQVYCVIVCQRQIQGASSAAFVHHT